MMPPSESVRSKAQQWLEFGDGDLTASHILLASEKPPYRIAAYHAHLAVEKHLKGYLVFHGIEFPYTHNIESLLEL